MAVYSLQRTILVEVLSSARPLPFWSQQTFSYCMLPRSAPASCSTMHILNAGRMMGGTWPHDLRYNMTEGSGETNGNDVPFGFFHQPLPGFKVGGEGGSAGTGLGGMVAQLCGGDAAARLPLPTHTHTYTQLPALTYPLLPPLRAARLPGVPVQRPDGEEGQRAHAVHAG